MYACQRQKRLIDDHMISFVAEHEMLANAIIEKNSFRASTRRLEQKTMTTD